MGATFSCNPDLVVDNVFSGVTERGVLEKDSSALWVYDTLSTQLHLLCRPAEVALMQAALRDNAIDASAYDPDLVLAFEKSQLLIPSGYTRKIDLPERDSFEIWLQTVNHCNLACMGCTTGMDVKQERKNNMPVEKAPLYFEKIFRDSTELGLRRVRIKFGGGEPTLAGTEWLRAVTEISRKTADKMGIETEHVLLTNGVSIAPGLIRALVDESIRFSISLDPERVIPQTGNPTFPRVIKNLERLKVAGAKGNGQYTVYKGNIHLLPSVYRTVSDLGFNISFSIFRPQTKEQMQQNRASDLIPGLDRFFTCVYKRIVGNKFHGQIGSFDYMDLQGVKDRVCGAGSTYIVLDHDGSIHTCHEDIKGGTPLAHVEQAGNIFTAIQQNFAAHDTVLTSLISGNGDFDRQGGKGCPWVRAAENGTMSESSRNTQEIYNHVGRNFLGLRVVAWMQENELCTISR